MSRALFLANRARESADVPVGAVVIDSLGRIVGKGWNCRESDHDPAGHAEIVALREAGKTLKRWNLVGCTLVVTLEPCTMCAGAAIAARVDRVVFGAWDPKAGAAGSLRDVLRDSRLNHSLEVIGGVLGQEATVQLRAFFESRREHAAEATGRAALADAPAKVPAFETVKGWADHKDADGHEDAAAATSGRKILKETEVQGTKAKVVGPTRLEPEDTEREPIELTQVCLEQAGAEAVASTEVDLEQAESESVDLTQVGPKLPELKASDLQPSQPAAPSFTMTAAGIPLRSRRRRNARH
ncbi:tRNA adenosine(34) deaminase TadA [Schaalia vaccimaxillae]|uniref:tRNA adenosine(34) deaminase TadA n=1 Tax=Schaalia vaccimaxillae TaxID=183916 RepID=UPI001FB08825